jgi:hypothetical protein
METKDLREYIDFLKGMVIGRYPYRFTADIAEPFRHGLDDAQLEEGITAYNNFLYTLFDKIANADEKFKCKKRAKKQYERGNFFTHPYYPIVNDVAWSLYRLGQAATSRLETAPSARLVIDDMTKSHEHFYLDPGTATRNLYGMFAELGFRFTGVDFAKDEVLYKPSPLIIEHENPAVVIGLKLIAQALDNVKDKAIRPHNIIMRGDFYPLTNPAPAAHELFIHHFTFSLPAAIAEWLHDIHDMLAENGCQWEAAKNNVGSNVHFVYSIKQGKKTKGLCMVNIDMNGCTFTLFDKEDRIYKLDETADLDDLKRQIII